MMRASKVIFVFLAILFVVVVAASIFTLSVSALDNGQSTDSGKWAAVCCGGCPTNQDFCIGDGTYKCCK